MNGFYELSDNELEQVDGGASAEKVGIGLGCIVAGCGAASYFGGSSVLLMGVGACAACGPVGWACIGACVLGAAAGGWLIGRGIFG